MGALLFILLLFVSALFGCFPQVSNRVELEERNRIAWESVRENEENDHWKLDCQLRQLGDSDVLMSQQINRIMLNEHLDLAALRVEQIRDRLPELRKSLTAQGRYYYSLPPLLGPTSEQHIKNLTQKQIALAEILDLENGKLAQTTKALTKLIDALEHGQADREAAKHAMDRLIELQGRLYDFRRLTAPGETRLVEMLIEIELRQRQESVQYRQMRDQIIGRPWPFPLDK